MSKDLSSLFNETVEGDDDMWNSFGARDVPQTNGTLEVARGAPHDVEVIPEGHPQSMIKTEDFDWDEKPLGSVQRNEINWEISAPSAAEPTANSDFNWGDPLPESQTQIEKTEFEITQTGVYQSPPVASVPQATDFNWEQGGSGQRIDWDNQTAQQVPPVVQSAPQSGITWNPTVSPPSQSAAVPLQLSLDPNWGSTISTGEITSRASDIGSSDFSAPPPIPQATHQSSPISTGTSGRSLIAARRLQQHQNSPDLLKPEVDVIYKQYNPNPQPVLPPPPQVQPQMPFPPTVYSPVPRGIAHHTPPSSDSNLHVGGPFDPSIPSMVTKQPAPSLPKPLVNVGPFDRPVVSSSYVQPIAQYIQQQPVVQPAEMERKRAPGLQSFVSIGFGGRVVMAGGRFGSRVKLGCLSDILASSKETGDWLNEIRTCPAALGSISDFTTESIQGFCRMTRKHNTSAVDRFGMDSMRDSQLVLEYLGYMLQPKPTAFGAPNNRSQFIAKLWGNACIEYRLNTGSVLFQYLDKVVRGDMRSSIEVARNNPGLHSICMAVSSIHSAEFFRESILLFTNSLGTREPPHSHPLKDDSVLIELVRGCLTAFASSTNGSSLEMSDEIVKYWKIYACLIGVLAKPGGDQSGGIYFLNRLGVSLSSEKNVCGGQLCVLLATKNVQLDSVDSSDASLCLLGADHRDISHFYRLLDSGPLILSELLEYTARKTSGGAIQFFMPLQPWKFAYASMLACDLGFFDVAEKYVEIINAFIRAVPTGKYTVHFRNALRELEVRIRGGDQAHGNQQPPSIVGITDVGQAALGALWGSIKSVTSR